MKHKYSARLACWLGAAALLITACAPVYKVTADQNPCSLPVGRAGVVYREFIGKRVIPIEELFMVARAWMRHHTAEHSLEQERPVFKKTLLYSALIPPSRINADHTTYRSKPRVEFWITVDAERDTVNVFLSSYRVHGIRGSCVDLEQVLTDTAICRAVDRESRQVLESLSACLRRHNQRLL